MPQKTLHPGQGSAGDKEGFFYHDGWENGNVFQPFPIKREAESAGDNDLRNALAGNLGTGQKGVDSGAHRPFGELESPDIRLGDDNFAACIPVKTESMSVPFRTKITGQIRFDLRGSDNPAAGIDETVFDGDGDQGEEATAG